MKKILLTLALAFCCVAGQGQTTAIPAGVNIQELNTKWAKFTQYAEQKQINKAVEEGIRISTLFTQNRQYKEGSPDKPGGLSIQLCKSEKKEFYIRYSS